MTEEDRSDLRRRRSPPAVNAWGKARLWLSQTWNGARTWSQQIRGKARIRLSRVFANSLTWLNHACRRGWAWLGQNSTQLQLLFGLAQTASLVFIIFGLWLIHQQLQSGAEQFRHATRQPQASAAGQEAVKGSRELLMRVWDDSKLRPILDPATKNTDSKKIDGFVFILLQHYSSAFRQWQQGIISQEDWGELAVDIRQFLKSPEVRKRWLQLRDFYSKEFQAFVEKSGP